MSTSWEETAWKTVRRRADNVYPTYPLYIYGLRALTGIFGIRKGPKTAPCHRAIN